MIALGREVPATQPPLPERAQLEKELSAAQVTLGPLTELARNAPPLKSWLTAVEQIAYRAALLICGDMRLVHTLVRTYPMVSDDPREECFYKLLLFSVSPNYLTLRRELGLSWAS
jgi:hypothetical protein